MELISEAIALTFLGVASVYDLKTREVPNELWLLAFPFAFYSLILQATANPSTLMLFSICSTFLFALQFYGMKEIGGADAKALMFLGLAYPLRFIPLQAFLLTLLVFLGVALIRRTRGKKDAGKYPMLPILLVGLVSSLLLGR